MSQWSKEMQHWYVQYLHQARCAGEHTGWTNKFRGHWRNAYKTNKREDITNNDVKIEKLLKALACYLWQLSRHFPLTVFRKARSSFPQKGLCTLTAPSPYFGVNLTLEWPSKKRNGPLRDRDKITTTAYGHPTFDKNAGWKAPFFFFVVLEAWWLKDYSPASWREETRWPAWLVSSNQQDSKLRELARLAVSC